MYTPDALRLDESTRCGAQFVVDFVRSQLHRIQSLVLDLSRGVLKLFRPISSPPTSALREIHIHCDTSSLNCFYNAAPDVYLADDTSPEKVCLQWFLPPRVIMKWDMVQEIIFKNVTHAPALHALSQATSVSSVAIALWQDEEFSYPPLPVLKPTVKNLVLNGMDALMMSSDLYTVMPSLTTLSIKNASHFGHFLPRTLSFLNHSSSTLTTLAIKIIVEIDEHDLVALLNATTMVADLTLQYYPHATSPFSTLNEELVLIQYADAHFHGNLLPNLQKLKYVVERAVYWRTLLEAILSRRNPDRTYSFCQPLRDVAVYLRSDEDSGQGPDRQDTLSIIELRRSGYSISIHQEHPTAGDLDLTEESMKLYNLD